MVRNVCKDDKYGDLVVIEPYAKKDTTWMHLCRCSCGHEDFYYGKKLKRRAGHTCTHKKEILPGKKYGRLTVAKCIGIPNGKNTKYYECICDCGNICIVVGTSLTRLTTKSCGCFKRDLASRRFYKYGGTKSHLYFIWSTMKRRCYKENAKGYKYWGGKGIKICDEWFDFLAFKNWALSAGYADGLSIDRINNDGNYCPENCRWITRAENARKSQLEKKSRILHARQLVGA